MAALHTHIYMVWSIFTDKVMVTKYTGAYRFEINEAETPNE